MAFGSARRRRGQARALTRSRGGVYCLTGQPRVYRSGPQCERYFCPDCGAQVALFTELAPATIDITIATLDDPDRYPPDRHIWVSSKPAWLSLDDGMPREDEERL